MLVRPLIRKAASSLPSEKSSVNKLFTTPLIFAAALLSFAHGANDVANAVGPLAAINDAVLKGGVATKAAIPLWVMMVGAIGIAIGLIIEESRPSILLHMGNIKKSGSDMNLDELDVLIVVGKMKK